MHLAQLNIAKAKATLDDPLMQECMDNLDPVNAIAEASPGFIWRLKDENGDATSIQVFDNPRLIVNMSVWESIDSLKDFMFKTHHLNFLKRKNEWFEKINEANHVLWWVAVGHVPTVVEAKERLLYLREQGESDHAFTFRTVK